MNYFDYKQGDLVERGQLVGLIKFGSRVDVLVPAEAVLQVKVGQRVNGGSSVLAMMGEGALVARMETDLNRQMRAKLGEIAGEAAGQEAGL